MSVDLKQVVGFRFTSTRPENVHGPESVTVSEMLQPGWCGKVFKLCGKTDAEAVQFRKEYWETLTAFAGLITRVNTLDAVKLPITIEIELRE